MVKDYMKKQVVIQAMINDPPIIATANFKELKKLNIVNYIM